MRKLIGRVVLLALILVAAILLRNHIKAARTDAPPSEETESAEAVEVMKTDGKTYLGTVTENAEQGGVVITATDERGAEKQYVFTDVAPESWYVEAVNYAVSNGLMSGVADQELFQPEYGLTREAFAVILYRFAKGEPVESPRNIFDDVPDYEWYEDAVYWIAEKRILSGLTETHFGVGEFLTVEQALQSIYRLAGRPKTEATLADYPYAPKVSEDGRSAVAWAWDNGLISESECVWYPTQTISRAQVALLLMRYNLL